MPDPHAFPLTAEQIVRGLGFALAQVVNARRHPSAAVPADRLILELGACMGVALPVKQTPPIGGSFAVPDELLPCGTAAGGEDA